MSITELLSREPERKEREYTGKIGAHLLGQCRRRQYWSIKREPQSNPPDARTRRIFAVGNLIHKYVQNKISDVYQTEVPYENEAISIRADGLGENEIVEIKSMHSRGFWRLTRDLKTKTIKEAKSEVALQATLGAKCFNKEFIILIFVSRDDLSIEEFKIRVSEEMLNDVTKEVEEIQSALKSGLLPGAVPRLYRQEDGSFKECLYCPWKDKCALIEKEKTNG